MLSLGLIVNSCFFAAADQISADLKGRMEDLRSKIERVFIPLSQDKNLSSNLNLSPKKDTEEHFLRNLYFYLYLKTIKDLNAGVQNFAALQENGKISFEEGYAKKNKNEIIAIYNRFKHNGDTLSDDDRKKVLQLPIKQGVANVAQGGVPPPPGGLAINPIGGAIQVPFWGNIQDNDIFDLTEIEALFKNLNKKLFELKLKDEFTAMRSRLQNVITDNLNPAMNKELDAFNQNFVPIFYNFSQLMQQRFRRNGQVIEDLSNIQKDIKSVVVTLKFLCKNGLNLETEVIRILSDLVQNTENFVTNFFDNILMNREQYLHTISLIRKTFNKPNNTAEAKTNRLKELALEKIAAETIKTYTKILKIQGINDERKQEIRHLINNLETHGYQDDQDINFTNQELGLIKSSMPSFKSLTDSIAELNRLVNNNVELPHNEVEDVDAQRIAEAARLQKEREENQLINEINDLLTQKNEGENYSVAEFLIEVYRRKHDKFSIKNDKGNEIAMEGDNAAKAKALLDQLVTIKAENNEPIFDTANGRPDKATYRTTYTDLTKIVCAECVRLIYKTENMKIGGQNDLKQAIDEIESAQKNANAMYGCEATFGIVMKSIKK